jgi:DNA-binding NtrC family response regulator
MFEGFKVVFVEDDATVRRSLAQTLELTGIEVLACDSAEAALPHLWPGLQGMVISDIQLPGMNGLQLLEHMGAVNPAIPVVLITAHGDVTMAVQAMRAGAYDFIEKPFSPERFIETAQRALEKRMLNVAVENLRTQLQQKLGIEAALLGNSAAMVRVREQILKLAATSADVMIQGETGTGKELVARCLHDHSKRRDRHFVALNCGGLPETLFESELFGHEAGAFTTASKRRVGKIEHANGGTLLLDEIESMPLLFQVKLLRVLQERKVERLGSNDEVKVDIRVVAATKSDLLALSREQKFRSDLYYRLNVAVVQLPPLRERKEDLPLLFEHFVAQAALRYGCAVPGVSGPRMQDLMAHDWPGNVREVRNVADRFVLALPPSGEGSEPLAASGEAPAATLVQQMDVVEKVLIEQALKAHKGRPTAVAQALGIARKTLYDKLHRHALSIDSYR